jgi:hypothetical protein
MSNIGYHILRIGLWCFLALFNMVTAAFITLIAALVYEWMFPDPAARWAASYGIADTVRYFGWTKGLAVFGASFLLIALLYSLRTRNFDRELESEFLANQADLKLVFGSASTLVPDGVGYTATLSTGGKQFEANCYTYASHMKGSSIYTATSAVTFPLADRTFELSLVQKWGWLSPKEEPPNVVPKAHNLLDILQARYDCHCSDRRVIEALLADPAVRREILPTHVPQNERSKITVRGGLASFECSAELRPPDKAARAATYVLMKKMIGRAQALDTALRRILNPQQQDV